MNRYILMIMSILVTHAQLKFTTHAGISGHDIKIEGLVVQSIASVDAFRGIQSARDLDVDNFPTFAQRSIYVQQNNTGTVWENETSTAYIVKANYVSSNLVIVEPNLFSVPDSSATVGVVETSDNDLEITLTDATYDPTTVSPYTYSTGSFSPTVSILSNTTIDRINRTHQSLVDSAQEQAVKLSNHNQFEAIALGGDLGYYYQQVFAQAGISYHIPVSTHDDEMNYINFDPESIAAGHIGVGIRFQQVNEVSINAGINRISGKITATQPPNNIDPNKSYSTIATPTALSQQLMFIECSFSHKPKQNSLGFTASVRQGYDQFDLSTRIDKLEMSELSANFALNYQF